MASFPNQTSGTLEVPFLAPIENFHFLTKMIFALLLGLLTWRMWKFTVLPCFHPSHPKEFPSWLPCKTYKHNNKFTRANLLCLRYWLALLNNQKHNQTMLITRIKVMRLHSFVTPMASSLKLGKSFPS